ncbi:hypothetical protein [Acidovorax sp. LjRoot194]|uniref:hypothetical protein n=1 Tax=Acidovorax sp. LjRoot194 TaxID=3342280 RepID=UPI003ECD8DFE
MAVRGQQAAHFVAVAFGGGAVQAFALKPGVVVVVVVVQVAHGEAYRVNGGVLAIH